MRLQGLLFTLTVSINNKFKAMKKFILLIFSVLSVFLMNAQRITPDQIESVKYFQLNAAKRYTMITDTATGRFWYADVDSLKGRTDTVNISPNRVITLNDQQHFVFMSARSGTWQQGNGVTFRLPPTPSHGQEIVITNQFGIIPSNTRFLFTATGGYSFRFPTLATKAFAYDPLSINTTGDLVFTSMECQFRCVANAVDKKWSCFVTSQ